MAKKNEKGLLQEIASFTGHLSGSVGGAVRAAVDLGHGLGLGEQEPVHEDVHFEKSDVNSRGVIIGGICFLAGMWLSIGLLFFYFVYLKNYRAEVSPPALPATRNGTTLPPEPRLQSSPEQDVRAFRAREDWELTHYYWLDKSMGRIAIPVEQAIQILAKRGVPPQDTAPNPTLTPPREGTRSTGFEGKVEPEPR
jgi:hypothetical protein